MADKKVIAATLQVDTAQANAAIKETNKNITEVKGNLNETSTAASKTGKAVEGTGGSFSKLKEQISAVPGPLGKASEGVSTLSGAFKALLANPVVLVLTAIVGVLALLYKAFTNTFEGAEKVEQIFAGIKAVGQSLLDNLGSIASAIKNVFTFNFSGAVKDIQEVTGAAKKAYTEMAELTKQAQELHREQLSNDLDQAERQKKLAQLREQSTDETVPLAERKKALLELRQASEENAKGDIDLAKRTTENIIAQAKVQKDGLLKNQDEINAAKIKQINVETDNANELRRINKQIIAADKQAEAERKAIEKEADDRRKESIRAQKEHAAEEKRLLAERLKNEAEYWKARKEKRDRDIADIEGYGAQLAAEQARLDAAQKALAEKNIKDELTTRKKLAELDELDNPNDPAKKIALIQSNLALELSALKDGDLQKQILEKKAADAILKINKDNVDAKKQLSDLEVQHNQEKFNAISSLAGNFATLLGRQTVIGKAFAIVQTTIDTYQSAIASYKSLAGIPVVGPTLGAVAAAVAIANGLATVKKIVSVQVPGGGGGASPSIPGGSAPAAPLAPQASSTRLPDNQINQIGSAAQPVQAFVVESSGANSQERISRLSRAARLGG